MHLDAFWNMIFKCYLTSHGISIIAKQISSFKLSFVYQCFLLRSSPSMAMPTKCSSLLSSSHINCHHSCFHYPAKRRKQKNYRSSFHSLFSHSLAIFATPRDSHAARAMIIPAFRHKWIYSLTYFFTYHSWLSLLCYFSSGNDWCHSCTLRVTCQYHG